MKITLELDTTNMSELAQAVRALQALAKSANGTAPAQPAQAQLAEAKCPTHNFARPSGKGGLYCPKKLADGTYCTWKAA
jgi:hypothetical protein